MVESRPTRSWSDDRHRPVGGPGDRLTGMPPAGSPPPRRGFRERIPTMAQLAALVVNGVLRLPRNYHRGMFLDILA